MNHWTRLGGHTVTHRFLFTSSHSVSSAHPLIHHIMTPIFLTTLRITHLADTFQMQLTLHCINTKRERERKKSAIPIPPLRVSTHQRTHRAQFPPLQKRQNPDQCLFPNTVSLRLFLDILLLLCVFLCSFQLLNLGEDNLSEDRSFGNLA